jgi:hypothetical protein
VGVCFLVKRHRQSRTKPCLSPDEILEQVFKRLKKYKRLNLFEQFAMFMGKAQLLELGVKSLLVRRYSYDYEKIKKWTLGKTARELKKCGLRGDFIFLLESVVDYRNYIAHELLANDAMLKSLTGGDSGRLELRTVEKGTIELEQILFLYDWTEEHNAWV